MKPSTCKLLLTSLAFLFATLVHGQETWTAISSPTTQNLWSACYGGGQFVAVGEGGTILTSPDGTVWTKRVSGNSLWLVSVGYGNGLFVVVGDQGTILTSPDGITWTQRRTGGTRINAVAYGNGFFLAVDEGGGSWKSQDGISWTFNPTVWSGTQLRGLVFVTPTFVVTGASGRIQVTNDGTNWTPRSINTTNFIESIAYGRRTYVVLGATNLTFTSRDNATWTPQQNSPAYFHGVGYFNELFVGAADNGTVVTSPDGKVWTTRQTGATQLLIAVANSENTGIVVGFGGTILRSAATSRAPTILDDPDSLVEAAGNNVLLRVSAGGSLPLNYQWYFNGAAIAGETNETLFLKNAQPPNSGRYSATVRNSVGVATSASSVLSVVPSFAETTSIIDPTFTSNPPPTSAPVTAAEQPDGKIIVGGKFIYLLDGAPQFGIARLNVDGSLDSTFKVGAGVAGPDASVSAIAVQSDGKVILGGAFTSVAGVERLNIARLQPSGAVDSAFIPPLTATGAVSQITLQSDGKVLVLAGTTIVRLNADGTYDQAFAATELARASTTKFAYSPTSGRIIAAVAKGAEGRFITAFTSTGAIDNSFTPINYSSNWYYDTLQLLAIAQGEKVLFGGGWAFTGGSYSVNKANRDGTPDQTFTPISGVLYYNSTQVLIDSAERVVVNVGSSFRGGNNNPIITRYNLDGTIDTKFRFNASLLPNFTTVNFIPLSNGRLLITGDFSSIDGNLRSRIARTVANNGAESNPPQISPSTPVAAKVVAGTNATFDVVAAGSGPFTYSSSGGPSGGSNLSGPYNTVSIINGRVTITNAQFSGVYSIKVANAAGEATSYFSLEVTPTAPSVQTGPKNLSVNSGRTAVFNANTTGTDPRAYQWFFENTPIGTNSSTLTLSNVTAKNAGAYTVVVRNSLGTITSSARLTVDDSSRLANIATRGVSGTGEKVLIVGFVIDGPSAKTVLLRGVGPTLTSFGLSETIANPVLSLFDSTGTKIAENDNWGTAGGGVNAALFSTLGAFPLASNSVDSALMRTLEPGRYTAQLTDAAGGSGVGLVEIYENDLMPSRLVNLSSRVFVGTGASLAIPGIVVRGPVSKKLLIRAVGPTLSAFGIQAALLDPTLTIVDSSNETVTSNDNWSDAGKGVEVGAIAASVGAFAFPVGSKDAAVLVTLAPGNYTALVKGSGDSSGVALVEVYEVP